MKWYMNNGEKDSVVLSTRVRLARNLSDFPFPVRLDKEGRQKVINLVSEVLLKNSDGSLKYVDVNSMAPVEILSLAERHLVSPEFASARELRALLLSDEEDVSIMLCEEDHIRLQIMYSGLALEQAYKAADKIDGILESKLNFAFDERVGYLTQCPTNLGTGLRASLLLHLPGLSRIGHIQRLASTVAKLGLTLRATYGEGSSNNSDIYQLSNQVTLGISEKAALQNLESIARQIISQEEHARETVVKDERCIDKIYRAYGIMKNAHMMSWSEFMSLASLVRLGVSQGVLEVDYEKINELFICTQPATLNAQNGGNLDAGERDVIRARQIKETLN